MMLLVGATLLMTSFVKLATVDPGYDPAGVVTFQVTVPNGRDMATFASSSTSSDRLRDCSMKITRWPTRSTVVAAGATDTFSGSVSSSAARAPISRGMVAEKHRL